MNSEPSKGSFFATESVWKILLRIAPPVMIAQLIQSIYTIMDSYFVGQYDGSGLTALSVIYPIQLIVTALAVGTGVGVNTQMSRLYAQGRSQEAREVAGTGTVLAFASWAVFAAAACLFMRGYAATSASEKNAVDQAVTYGLIVSIGSLGVFLESIWTKVHQAGGNMRVPMIAQISGAVTNIVLDPLLIFGLGFFPRLGIAGAAIATVTGQCVAACITGIRGGCLPSSWQAFLRQMKPIYRLGYPSIFMQMLYTVYIAALNMILAQFSDAAVTVLGLYYKVQTIFFIPLLGLQTCIVPVLSYNFARGDFKRCKKILGDSILTAAAFMLVGVFCFECIPHTLIGFFSSDSHVLTIGQKAFRILGTSFLPAVISLILPVFFQAIGMAKPSVVLSLTRQIVCLIPIFWGLSLIGLDYAWIAFPAAEAITGCLGLVLYARLQRLYRNTPL